MELLSVVLFAAGMILVVMEVFLPGAILGFLGAAGVVGGVWLGLQANAALGIGEIVLGAVAIPISIVWGVRRMQLKASIESARPNGPAGPPVGASGEVVSDLRPGGVISIDGRRYDALSVAGHVASGARVSVVRVEGNRIFVRAL